MTRRTTRPYNINNISEKLMCRTVFVFSGVLTFCCVNYTKDVSDNILWLWLANRRTDDYKQVKLLTKIAGS